MAPKDPELQVLVELLFRLWEDIRWIYRAMPKTVQVAAASERWVTNPPTQAIIPRLIKVVEGQEISTEERVMIVMALTLWSDAYTGLIGISSLPRDQRPAEMYSQATKSLAECSGWLKEVVGTGDLKRDLRLKGRTHGTRPRRNRTPRAPGR